MCVVKFVVAPQETASNMTARVQIESAGEVYRANCAPLRGLLPEGLADAVGAFAGSEPVEMFYRSFAQGAISMQARKTYVIAAGHHSTRS